MGWKNSDLRFPSTHCLLPPAFSILGHRGRSEALGAGCSQNSTMIRPHTIDGAEWRCHRGLELAPSLGVEVSRPRSRGKATLERSLQLAHESLLETSASIRHRVASKHCFPSWVRCPRCSYRRIETPAGREASLSSSSPMHPRQRGQSSGSTAMSSTADHYGSRKPRNVSHARPDSFPTTARVSGSALAVIVPRSRREAAGD